MALGLKQPPVWLQAPLSFIIMLSPDQGWQRKTVGVGQGNHSGFLLLRPALFAWVALERTRGNKESSQQVIPWTQLDFSWSLSQLRVWTQSLLIGWLCSSWVHIWIGMHRDFATSTICHKFVMRGKDNHCVCRMSYHCPDMRWSYAVLVRKGLSEECFQWGNSGPGILVFEEGNKQATEWSPQGCIFTWGCNIFRFKGMNSPFPTPKFAHVETEGVMFV